MALGVGSAKILGRVHAADMKILDQNFPCSFTILEDNKVDLLFGLDNLKRHKCELDFVNNLMHFRNRSLSVPFLSDGEIKKGFMEEEKEHMMKKQE